MTQDIEIQNMICKRCGCTYDAQIAHILGHDFMLGQGYCPGCRKELLAEERKQAEAARLASIAKIRREWRAECGIPLRFMYEDFTTFKAGLGEGNNITKVKKKCLQYAQNYPIVRPQGYASMLLFSDRMHNAWGNGKTHLACAVAHSILDRWNGETAREPVLFITETGLFRRIQATYNIPEDERTWHETEQDVLYQLSHVPLLILDDLGKQERSDPRFVQRILYDIVNGRYEAMLPMIITANLSPDELQSYLGGGRGNEATMDRLVEMCEVQFSQVVGDSYREQKGGASGL